MGIELTIPDDAWRPVGHPDPRARLQASLSINETPFFAEAVRIREGSFGQEAQQADGDATIQAMFELDPESPFYTTPIRGAEYLVVLYPSKQ